MYHSKSKELLQLVNEQAADEIGTEEVGVETGFNLP